MKMLRILIVDDSSVMRQMVRRTVDLTQVPVAEMHEAANGQEALAVLSAHQVDAVFTDLNMPVMTGTELLQELARRSETVPVRVVISSDGTAARREEMQGLCVDHYLAKPLRPEVMRDVLSEIAQRIAG